MNKIKMKSNRSGVKISSSETVSRNPSKDTPPVSIKLTQNPDDGSIEIICPSQSNPGRFESIKI
jgi:hypothetical protein